MNAYKFHDVNKMYANITDRLLNTPLSNGTRELQNVLLTVENVDDAVITLRDTSLPYLCGELLWYTSGSNDVNFISNFAKKWKEITDDGVTSNSAYGFILKKKHGFNQLDKMVELIKSDINTRRAVINFNVPNVNVIDTKDEICTIASQYLVRDGKLHCTTMMRSNDIYTGMPYDIAYFISLQKIVAHKLNIPCGTYTHFVTSLHLYASVEQRLRNALTKEYAYVNIDAVKLLDLTDEDYEMVARSQSPKECVIILFKDKKILVEEQNENTIYKI